ncbi:ester cyclase [Nonomuraea sp. K274]|uniref:Ester cyclase n=1 Tax=Nonomuraea cypriaca TaxID=1187855 RepID=A0A931ACT7_9ACTN|nr:ester cyclase [Nonomuraea cypriaca]MBF8186917.1 ester cyclase [Nonomuraea cypriaca]
MDAHQAAVLHMDAWNGHDPARVAATADLFDAPGTGGPVAGEELRAHAAELFEAFPGLKFGIDVEASGPGHAVLSWTLDVEQLGRYLGVPPTQATATISGTDTVRAGHGRVHVARAFDRLDLLDRLGIQVSPQPQPIRGWEYGLGSRLETTRAERPGALVLTRLDAADQQEEEQVGMLSAAVTAGLRNSRGFLGAAELHVGGRMYTLSAFDRPESTRAVHMKPHQRAVRRFFRSGLCTGGAVTVWTPLRISDYVRCPGCGSLNELSATPQCACGRTPGPRPLL